HILELTDSKVIDDYWALNGSSHHEHELSNIRPTTVSFKAGANGLTHIAWFCFFGAVVASLLHFLPSIIYFSAVALFGTAAAICVLIYFIDKDEYEAFYTKNDNFIFQIRITKTGEEKPFLEELKRKISR